MSLQQHFQTWHCWKCDLINSSTKQQCQACFNKYEHADALVSLTNMRTLLIGYWHKGQSYTAIVDEIVELILKLYMYIFHRNDNANNPCLEEDIHHIFINPALGICTTIKCVEEDILQVVTNFWNCAVGHTLFKHFKPYLINTAMKIIKYLDNQCNNIEIPLLLQKESVIMQLEMNGILIMNAKRKIITYLDAKNEEHQHPVYEIGMSFRLGHCWTCE